MNFVEKKSKKLPDRANFLNTFSACFHASQNRNNNNNNNTNQTNRADESLNPTAWLMSRIRRSLLQQKNTINPNQDNNDDEYDEKQPIRVEKINEITILKNLMTEIDQLKSSNSELWLQIQEILSGEAFRTSTQPSDLDEDVISQTTGSGSNSGSGDAKSSLLQLVVNEPSRDSKTCMVDHVYENVNSSEGLMLSKLETWVNQSLATSRNNYGQCGDGPNKEVAVGLRKKAISTKVAEKIEKFNQLALERQRSEKRNQVRLKVKNEKNRSEYNSRHDVIKREVAETQNKTNSKNEAIESEARTKEPETNRKDDYESMVRIKESIEKFKNW